MKLHPDYITHMSGTEQIIVATGESTKNFCGIARGNETTALIVEQLQNSTTREQLLHYLLDKYDVDRTTVESDVDMVLGKLRSIGALVDEED